jgi:hypothetical protein
VDEDEDSAAAQKREQLAAQLHRRLSDIPDPLPLEAAAAMFVADLEMSRAAFTRHDQMGCVAAMLAAVRMCHALGHPDLTDPFTAVGLGLRDLQLPRRMPALFRKGEGAKGSGKSNIEWNLSVTLSVHLDILSKEIGMKMPDAAKEIARILIKRKIYFGDLEADTWHSVMSAREEIRRRPKDDEVKNQYFYHLAGYKETLAFIHPNKCKAEVLAALDKILRSQPKFPGSPPSNP